MTRTTEAEAPAKGRALVCTGCDRELEWCSFCGEEEGCPAPSCYPCLSVAVGQSRKVLHPHGG